MTDSDELARFRDEHGRKWVLIHSHDGALQMWRLDTGGRRDGPHSCDDISRHHHLTRLYPPPEPPGDLS